MGPDLSDSLHMPRMPSSRSVWRVALLWQGTVLDVVTLGGTKATLRLRTGEVLRARVVEGGVEITGNGDALSAEALFAEDGVLLPLAAGHSLLATRSAQEGRAPELVALDSTLFHAAMIGAAVQACVVSALVLAPPRILDDEAGAGVKSEWRRLLLAPGGTAPRQGPAAVNAVGRPPEEAELRENVREAGRRPPHRTGAGVTAEQALEQMKRSLHLGNDGVELKEALGELAQATAQAPVTGAGMGGLSPRDPEQAGAGNGLVGPGESRLPQLLRKRIEENEKRAKVEQNAPTRAPIPVELIDVPAAQVSMADAAGQAFELDPVVKDHLLMAVRQRHNAIRYCYESWGLAADVRRSGRLVLELTLRPDGRVDAPRVSVENDGLKLVGECVEKMAADWYLGDGLVDEPRRMAFPFILQPHKDVESIDFDRPPELPQQRERPVDRRRETR